MSNEELERLRAVAEAHSAQDVPAYGAEMPRFTPSTVLSLLSDNAALAERVGVLERAIARARRILDDSDLHDLTRICDARDVLILGLITPSLHHPEADLGKGEA